LPRVILADADAEYGPSVDQAAWNWKQMKLAGFFLMVAGFFLTVAAVVLLQALGLRYAFVLSGLALECAGLAIVFRSHMGKARESH
jgi:predicted membrane channel-forming protein YqfA (hemolysin III family)